LLLGIARGLIGSVIWYLVQANLDPPLGMQQMSSGGN